VLVGLFLSDYRSLLSVCMSFLGATSLVLAQCARCLGVFYWSVRRSHFSVYRSLLSGYRSLWRATSFDPCGSVYLVWECLF